MHAPPRNEEQQADAGTFAPRPSGSSHCNLKMSSDLQPVTKTGVYQRLHLATAAPGRMQTRFLKKKKKKVVLFSVFRRHQKTGLYFFKHI